MWEVKLTELDDGFDMGEGGRVSYHRWRWDVVPLGGVQCLFESRDSGRPQVRLQSRRQIGWFVTGLNLRCCWDMKWRRQIGGRMRHRSAVQQRDLSYINCLIPSGWVVGLSTFVFSKFEKLLLGFHFLFSLSPFLWRTYLGFSSYTSLIVCGFWLRGFLNPSPPRL